MAKITGRVEVLVNGVLLLNKAGAKASGIGLSGEMARTRKAVIGDTGIHGYVEEPIEATCEVTVTDRDDIRLEDFAKINGDGTVIFRAANGGKQYTLKEATCDPNFEVSAGEGDVTIKFSGKGWIESVQ